MTKVVLLAFFLCFSTVALAVYEELGVEENNQFGGRSLIFRQLEEGVKRGKNSYDSAGKLMLAQRTYSEEWANSHGTASLTKEYLFEIKIQENRVFSLASIARRQVRQRVTYYEQATGTKTREENTFARPYLGNNKIYYNLGTKTRMEWFYPKNQEGYQEVVTYYNKKGQVSQVKSLYTLKSAKFDGATKEVIYYKDTKKEKEEWWFTQAYGEANKGAVRKMKVYFNNPNHPKKPQVYYFNAKNQVVIPNHPFEE